MISKQTIPNMTPLQSILCMVSLQMIPAWLSYTPPQHDSQTNHTQHDSLTKHPLHAFPTSHPSMTLLHTVDTIPAWLPTNHLKHDSPKIYLHAAWFLYEPSPAWFPYKPSRPSMILRWQLLNKNCPYSLLVLFLFLLMISLLLIPKEWGLERVLLDFNQNFKMLLK